MISVQSVGNYGRAKINSIEGDEYFFPVVDDKPYSCVCETKDIALLMALQIKYEGHNSQFAKMACRMLGIKSAWAE